MNIENGYFLARFDNKSDCEKVLSKGSWILFGQYLTVQPWTVSFDQAQQLSSIVMAWIKISGLLGYMYKHKILLEIGGQVGNVVKLDLNIDNRTRGRFTLFGVYVNLDKPLVSQILIKGKLQKVKYEFFPIVCFHCGRYGI